MTNPRIELLDYARGVALVAMTVFHFAFDLQLLGLKEPGFIEQAHWKYFARTIASSFLFLAGFSLFLAHSNGIRWNSWTRRLLKLVAAAALITIATYFATPDQYIFFGILHAIAFASIVGLLFLPIPWIATALIAIMVFGLGLWGRSELFDAPLLYWTGLSEMRPNSSDYVPVFPWMSAPLLGIAAAKFCAASNLFSALAKPKLHSPHASALKFIGRNSLVYYLIHQPVMLAIMIAVSWLAGWIAF